MTNKNKENHQENKQEMKLEDLPPDEEKTNNVKGGAGKSDLVNGIFD